MLFYNRFVLNYGIKGQCLFCFFVYQVCRIKNLKKNLKKISYLKKFYYLCINKKNRKNMKEMNTVSLDTIKAKYQMDNTELALVLFPDIKYPEAALSRVLRGDTDLTISQLNLLARHLGESATKLFDMTNLNAELCECAVLKFENNWFARLIVKADIAIVYRLNKPVVRIENVSTYSVMELINHILNIIKNGDNI